MWFGDQSVAQGVGGDFFGRLWELPLSVANLIKDDHDGLYRWAADLSAAQFADQHHVVGAEGEFEAN